VPFHPRSPPSVAPRVISFLKRSETSMQRVVVAVEPRRHFGDLLVSVLLQHPAHIAVASDRGLELRPPSRPGQAARDSAASSCCAIV
jgi:hypothetical protein